MKAHNSVFRSCTGKSGFTVLASEIVLRLFKMHKQLQRPHPPKKRKPAKKGYLEDISSTDLFRMSKVRDGKRRRPQELGRMD